MPTADAQEWLLDAMAEIVGRLGPGPWLSRPAVLPEAASFPDVYDETPTGVRTLLRRLASHVGLEARIELQAEEEPDAPVPLLFEDVRGGTVEITLFELRPTDDLIGHAVHAIAHAFHAVHRLDARPHGYRDGPDDGEDEELDAVVSVTAVYLGLGVLATRDAHRYDVAGSLDGGLVQTSWQHELIGGLSAESLAWLVALQTLLRDEPAAEVKAIERVLPPNPQAAFRQARAELAGRVEEMRERLGLRAAASSSAAGSSASLEGSSASPAGSASVSKSTVASTALAPLVLDPEGDARAEASWAERVRETEALVYRVPLPGPRLLAAIGGFVPALLLEAVLSQFYGRWRLILLIVIPAIAVMLASIRRPRCSACGTRLTREVTRCRGCGGVVAGDAASLRDVLDLPQARTVNGSALPSARLEDDADDVDRGDDGVERASFERDPRAHVD